MYREMPAPSGYKLLAVLIAAMVLVGCIALYGTYKGAVLARNVTALQTALDEQVLEHASSTVGFEQSITEHNRRIVELSDRLYNLERRWADVEDEFGDITDTVEDLEKLTNTDPELLQKYSKVYFLNEHYTPGDLAEIDEEFLFDRDREEGLLAPIYRLFEDMLVDARKDGAEMFVVSAYRSFDEQKELKTGYVVTYGAGTANQFSAEQGYSEHQLGTTVDLTTEALDGQLDGFETTDAYEWLVDHAYRYGFVLSYPKGNDYYEYEPWHWRYVGVALARHLHRNDEYFYDMEQREIDKYLGRIFD